MAARIASRNPTARMHTTKKNYFPTYGTFCTFPALGFCLTRMHTTLALLDARVLLASVHSNESHKSNAERKCTNDSQRLRHRYRASHPAVRARRRALAKALAHGTAGQSDFRQALPWPKR